MSPRPIDIPHRHPFRFVATGERRLDNDVRLGQIRVRLTHGGPWGRLDGGGFPTFFAIELMAQSCAVIMAGEADDRPASEPARPGLLAGVSDFELEAPLLVGDTLVVRAERQGSFGILTKVQATVERDGRTVARAGLLLSGEGIS